MNIDDETLEKFRDLVDGGGYDALEHWSKRINPKVINMKRVKKALLLTLASHGDEYGDRGRVHTLLKGEAGTGKSKLMMWIYHHLYADFTSHRSTDAGLTGDMRGEEITKGDLPMADGGAICCDELDKFSKKDREGLLESMSDGLVTLSGAGMKEQFSAEVRVIGGCNRTEGWNEELLDRWDFKFDLEQPSKEKTADIMSEKISSWMKPKDDYEGKELKKYLEWIHEFRPRIKDGVGEKMDNLVKVYITQSKENKGIRHQEGVIRVAFAIAKLHHRDVEVRDMLEAIILVNPDFKEKLDSMDSTGMVNGWLKEPLNEVLDKYDE